MEPTGIGVTMHLNILSILSLKIYHSEKNELIERIRLNVFFKVSELICESG